MSGRCLAVLALFCLSSCESGQVVGPPCDDRDGDGFKGHACGGNDCDDTDPAVHPGGVESCDGVDQDCDGQVDEGCACAPRDFQNCYPEDVDPATRNVGACSEGYQNCLADGSGWGECQHAVGPAPEATDCDGIDQDCDGVVDEDCACIPGQVEPCYPAAPGTRSIGACRDGMHHCLDGNAGWSECLGAVTPSPEGPICDGIDQDCDGVPDQETRNACGTCGTPTEVCGNGLDDDCDGVIDDPAVCNLSCKGLDAGNLPPELACCARNRPDCPQIDCEERTNQPCYSGPPRTAGKGICHGGTTSCVLDPQTNVLGWDTCQGQQLPQLEACNGLDDDCDGLIDEDDAAAHRPCPPPAGCRAGTTPGPERCGDGVDSNCNGMGGPGEPEDPGCCVPAEETCNGLDDDCDGLVDEGVSNACGKCGDEACQEIYANEPANCAQGSDRICSRIRPDENDPDAFTLGADSRGGPPNVAYFPVLARHAVAKLDTVTGQKLWEVDSQGDSPGPLAVSLDHSVWVVNRGLDDPLATSLVHLDRDGNLACRSPLPPGSRAVNVDQEGDIWVGRLEPPELRHFAGNATEGTDPQGRPLCASLEEAFGVQEPVADLAIDDRDVLWSASFTDRTVRLDLGTRTQEVIQHGGETFGVQAEGLELWFAGAPVHSIARDGPYLDRHVYERDTAASGNHLAVIPPTGVLWVTTGLGLTALELDSLAEIDTWPLPQAGQGVSEDDQGNIWVPMASGRAARFDVADTLLEFFDVDPGHALEAQGNFTGGPLLYLVARQGTWTEIFDGGYGSTVWRELTWHETTPYGAVVQVRARFSATREGLDTTPNVCGPFSGSPVDLLAACPGSRGSRFAAVEIALRSARSGEKPIVGGIHIDLTRP